MRSQYTGKSRQLDAEGKSDLYIWRASYLPVLNVDSQFVQQPEQNFEVMRIGIKEWKKISPYLLKDFYTLTPWHGGEDTTGMTAYSFYDEDAGKGILLAFQARKLRNGQPNGIFTLRQRSKGVYYDR